MDQSASKKNIDVIVKTVKEEKNVTGSFQSPKTFPYEEVFEATKEYFQGDLLATIVWVNKYALKDTQGKIYECTPDDMHRRIAREVARIENKYPNPLSEDEVFELIRNFRYIVPQGSPMTGTGNIFQIA